MPSEERYRELIAVLRETTTKSLHPIPSHTTEEAAALQLSLGLRALRAVMLYLQGDVEVLDGLLTRPLGLIETAVYNAGEGAKPALLNPPPPAAVDKDGELVSRKGKVPFTAREQVQGCLAFAVELLVASQMGKVRAIDWVAAEARRYRVLTEDGAPVTTRQIENCRSEISRGKAPAGACETFEGLRHMPTHAALLKGPHAAAKSGVCEARARGLIKALAASAPLAAPKQTSRLKP
jgi:hypothetical protein